MYTNNWFDNVRPVWEAIIRPRLRADADILEIGSWEGKSSCWLAEAAPKGRIVCVDTWQGGEENDKSEMPDVKIRFDLNTQKYSHQISSMQELSSVAMTALAASGATFDFIYIDGSHQAADVLMDAVLAFHLTRVGGTITFDDYAWDPWKTAEKVHRTPRPAIDAFLFCYRDNVRLLHKGWQVIVEKTSGRE